MGCDYWKVKQVIIEYFFIKDKTELPFQTHLDLRVTPMFFENNELVLFEQSLAEEDNEYIREKKMKQYIKSLFYKMKKPDPIVIYSNGNWEQSYSKYKSDVLNHVKYEAKDQPFKLHTIVLHEYFELA